MLRKERGITILDKYSDHVERGGFLYFYVRVYIYICVHIRALSTFTGLQERNPKEVCVLTDFIEVVVSRKKTEFNGPSPDSAP